MTTHKSFKLLVRARMSKTGESYTAARSMLLAGREVLDERKLPTTDERIRDRTGRGWEEWFEWLDARGASELGHREIAKLVAAELGVAPLAWNAQGVTSGYELTHGLREPGQKEDGTWSVSVSRTLAAPVERAYDAVVASLAAAGARERTATRPLRARFDWGEHGSRVHVTFAGKDDGRAVVSLQHVRLPAAADADQTKAYWRERLDAIKAELAS